MSPRFTRFAIFLCAFFGATFVTSSFVEGQENENSTKPTAETATEECVFKLPKPDDWQVGDRRPFATKEAGFTIAYNHELTSVTMTVYQFNRGLESISDSLKSEEIKEEMAGVKDAIDQARRLGYYDSATEKESKTVSMGESKTKALWARYTIEAGGEEVNSQCYLTTCKNRFIKIRVTFTDSVEANRAKEQLIEQIGKAIDQAKK